jgi:hypothetical protein
MESCIYVGFLRHRRRAPLDHAFEYPLFMMYLDLDELPTLFDGNPLWSSTRPSLAWFRRADHLGAKEVPLADAVRNLVESRLRRRAEGPVRLLTHLRYLGYGFNPVSFYYCFDADGERVDAIVAEINNTPWGEQHCYVVDGLRRDGFAKQFHVSPFMEMDQRYNWRFTTPADTLAVHMENHTEEGKIFDATLRLHREPITARSLNTKLVTYPLMTAQVIAQIYWQAFKLWWKKCPRFAHPPIRSAGEGVELR